MTELGDANHSDEQRTFRTLPARIMGWSVLGLGAIGAVVFGVAEMSRGQGGLTTVGVISVVCAVVWMGLLRPCVRLEDDQVVLHNLLTDVTVPFSRLAEVGNVWALELTDTGGRKHSAWAIPVRRDLRPARNVDRYAEATTKHKAHQGMHAEVVAGYVEENWQQWRRDGGRALTGGPIAPSVAATAVGPLVAAVALLVLSLIL